MKRQLNRITLLVVLLFSIGVQPDIRAINTIKREFRAVWVSTVYCLDWPTTAEGKALQGRTSATIKKQKARLCEILDSMQLHGFNAIFFQVRPMSDALYKSSYEPTSSYLTGTRGATTSWDPLEYAITEAHARGLELHAWVNPYRWAGSATIDWNTNWDKQVKANGWILTTEKGKILNPGLDEVRDHIVNVCEEIVTKYQVDGLVFDDYFYNSGTPTDETAGDYTLYINSGTKMSLADWRRNNVNKMIQAVYEMIQDEKPYIRFGISPAGVASKGASDVGITAYQGASDWQYDGIYSDPLAWLNLGIVDYISPQLYWSTTHETNPFGPLTNWWSKTADHFGRHHYASHSISSLSDESTKTDWAQYATQIQCSRNYSVNKAPGCVLFRSGFISGPNANGLGHYLQGTKFAKESIPPEITWKEHDAFELVDHLTISGDTLSWNGPTETEEIVKYCVYAIPNYITYTQAFRPDGDGISSDYLLGISYNASYTIPEDKRSGYGFAVCILDGYGKEYAPQTYQITGIQSIDNHTFAVNVNKNHLRFTQTAKYIQVYDTNGACLAHYNHAEEVHLDFSAGVYLVKAVSEGGAIITCKIILY